MSESENRLYDLTSRRVTSVSDSNASEARQVTSVSDVDRCEHQGIMGTYRLGSFKGSSRYQALVFRAPDSPISQEKLTIWTLCSI